MSITSEPDFGWAVMKILASQAGGQANTRTIIKLVPDYLSLSDEDREMSKTRPGEEIWEQRVRNLKSHSKIRGNVIAEGYVGNVARGLYRLTAAGWAILTRASAA